MIRDGETIRVGLIGYGFAGKTFHAPLIQSVPGFALTVIGSSQTEILQATYPGIIVCSATKVPRHPEVDLVVIASPNESHFPLAAAALRSGKDVVVDKPFTVTLAEARSLVEIARQNKRLLSVFHNRRWESEILAAKAILQAGVLGEVSHYESHWTVFGPAYVNAGARIPARVRDCGLISDRISSIRHCIFSAFRNSVNASFGILRAGGQTDDWAHVQLNYDRLRVVLHASLLVSGGGPRSVLHGTRASWAKFGGRRARAAAHERNAPGRPDFGYDPDPGICITALPANGRSGVARRQPANVLRRDQRRSPE